MITNVVTEFGGIGNGVVLLKTILYKRKWIKQLDYFNCALVLGLLTCFRMITNVVTEFGGIGNGVAFF